MTFDSIAEDFDLLDDWEDRYRYIIDLGKNLAPLGEENRDEAHRVRGCASQVWLTAEASAASDPVVTFRGDSDAHIVRGLIAIVIALYSGRTASEILAIDPKAAFAKLDLEQQITPQRSNGLFSMVERMRAHAEAAQTDR
ncbi:MAG: SufE family protein [Pseudomonadota bacterium]